MLCLSSIGSLSAAEVVKPGLLLCSRPVLVLMACEHMHAHAIVVSALASQLAVLTLHSQRMITSHHSVLKHGTGCENDHASVRMVDFHAFCSAVSKKAGESLLPLGREQPNVQARHRKR